MAQQIFDSAAAQRHLGNALETEHLDPVLHEIGKIKLQYKEKRRELADLVRQVRQKAEEMSKEPYWNFFVEKLALVANKRTKKTAKDLESDKDEVDEDEVEEVDEEAEEDEEADTGESCAV